MNLSAIITALGGRSSLQNLLNVGPSAISNYMSRGSLPNRAKPVVYAALISKGYNVRPDNLEILTVPSKFKGTELSPNSRPRILIIVSGGIAAYKALEVIRLLKQLGAQVNTVLTENAKQFITPLSLSALTGEKCFDNLFSLTDESEMGHIQLARSTDLVLVVPATANLMARANAGFADDLATTILLATTAKVAMAPAMNPTMWAHPATKKNFSDLIQLGVHMIGPISGDTACGEEGVGRMCEPNDIALSAMALVEPQFSINYNNEGALVGKRVLITSGPTIEPIDKVRFITNHSSGKQGHAIAQALVNRGADVTLISGPVNEETPKYVNLVRVKTATEMLAACTATLNGSSQLDIAICAAAVADWRAESTSSVKLKKPNDPTARITLELRQNPDVLATLAKSPNRPKLVIGFAAETESLVENATAKRKRKGCDWIIANQVGGDSNPVFGSAINQAVIIKEKTVETWPQMRKTEIAEKLADQIEAEFS